MSNRIVPAVLLIPFAAVIIVCVVSGIPDLDRAGDGALLEISTRNTAAGLSLTGPYSRYGFHHPGPLYFIVRIPLYYLSGRNASSVYITAALICILCFSAIFHILRKHACRLMLFFLCLTASVFLWSMKPDIWLNDWNPFIILFPLLLAIISFTAAAAGFHRYLPLAVAGGSFAVQTHIGCLPSVAAAAVFAAVFLFIRYRRNEPAGNCSSSNSSITKSLLTASVTGVILWVPVILHESVSDRGGNLSEIVRFFRETSPGLSLKRSIFIWIDTVSGMEGNLISGEYLRKMDIVFQVKAAIVLIRMFLLSGCCYLLYWKNHRGFTLKAVEMTLLLHITTLLAVTQVRGEPHTYLFTWFSLLGLLSWTVIFTSITETFDAFAGSTMRKWIIRICTAIIIAFSILNTASIWRNPLRNVWDPLSYHDESVSNLSDSLSVYLSAQKDGCWTVVPAEHDLWPLMAGLVNNLDKEGWNVSVSADFAFMTDIKPERSAEPLYIHRDSAYIHPDAEILCGYENNLMYRRIFNSTD